MATPRESHRHGLGLSANGSIENEISEPLQKRVQPNYTAPSTKLVQRSSSSLPPSRPSIVRVITGSIGSYVCILVRGARGAVEALIIDVKEVTWWLVRLCLSDQTFTRFHDQWQVFLSGASTSSEDEQLEKVRRRRCRTFVRLLGSLLPLAPVQRPYLRFVSLNTLSGSDDSLFNGSVRSGSVRSMRTPVPGSKLHLQSRPLVSEHNRPQLLRSEGTTNLSGYSNESGFSTAHYLDSDTSSCVDNDLLDEDTEGDHRSVTSGYSVAASEAAGPARRRKSQLKRRHSRRAESSRDGAGQQQRGSALESSLPFTDPAALEKIKSLETQLEELKLTISQIMNQQKGDKPPPTPPSSPTGSRRAPPPPPPPPTPSAPPPPPPPMPPTPTAANAGAGSKGSLQELLQSKQGQLSKTEVNSSGPKEQPGSWSSVISAIKGGGAKLKKVQRGPPSSKKPSSYTGDAYRAALAATLRQRFKSVQGSDDDTETEFSDSDAVKSGRWDSEAWQSPSSGSKPSLPQVLLQEERLKKTSPVKLAKEIKNSPDALLAAVNKKLYSAVSDKDQNSGALIFSTPKLNLPIDESEEKVPDSNELFRKFLQSDRKKRALPPKKSPSRTQSTPNFGPLVRSVSIQDSISTIPETPQLAADAGEKSTPVLSSSHKPRALSFSTEVQQSPFGQHMLKKRVSISNGAKHSNGSEPPQSEDVAKVNSAAADQPGQEGATRAGSGQASVTSTAGSSPQSQDDTLYLSFDSGDPRKLSSAQLQTNQ